MRFIAVFLFACLLASCFTPRSLRDEKRIADARKFASKAIASHEPTFASICASLYAHEGTVRERDSVAFGDPIYQLDTAFVDTGSIRYITKIVQLPVTKYRYRDSSYNNTAPLVALRFELEAKAAYWQSKYEQSQKDNSALIEQSSEDRGKIKRRGVLVAVFGISTLVFLVLAVLWLLGRIGVFKK